VDPGRLDEAALPGRFRRKRRRNDKSRRV